MLMSGVVVDDQVNRELSRYGGVDRFEERQEFLMAMTCLALRQDLPVGNVEGGKERGGAVPLIVVGDAIDVAKPHRQNRLGALERLNLAFFIDAQHDRVIRRIVVETDDVADLLYELRVGRELEAPGAVRLDPEQPQIAAAPSRAPVARHPIPESRRGCAASAPL
jgi:hypothetical protein